PVQPRLRGEHGGSEHGAVQQRAELRCLLRAQVRQRPQVVPLRQPFHSHHRHQLLPAQFRPAQRQWRMGAMPEEGRDPVHHQRVPLLQPGTGLQRGRRRRHCEVERERDQDRVDEHEPELGSELAVERRPRRSASVVQGDRKRPTDLHFLEHRSFQLAVRSDVHRQEFQGLRSGEQDHQFIVGLDSRINYSSSRRKLKKIGFKFPVGVYVLRFYFFFFFSFFFLLVKGSFLGLGERKRV
ncbi:unnamed protein product, partial [Linum tenue]